MTHLLKPDDRRDHGINGERPGCPALAVCIGTVFAIFSCVVSAVAGIMYLARVVGLEGW